MSSLLPPSTFTRGWAFGRHAAVVLLVACASCGGGTPEAASPATPEAAAPSAPGSGAAEAAPSPSTAAETPPAAASDTGSESLARDMLKRGGRRIGYSAQKKSFVYPEVRRTGASLSLAIVFSGEDGKAREKTRICQAGECDEQLDELARAALPKLAARLDSEGYAAVRAIGWPAGRDELDIAQLGMKLRYTGGRLEGVREGKPAVRIGAVGTGAPKLIALFLVPDAKLLAVVASPDGNEDKQEMYVLKLP